MKKQILYILALVLMVSVFTDCGSKSSDSTEDASQQTNNEGEEGHGEEGVGALHLSNLKFESLGIKIDSLPNRSLSGVVEANGQLEVPPQYEATVTAILGANVTSIKVIEGDKVNRGQVLAYLAHPNLSSIQSNYVRAYSQLQYLEKEHERQKKLYEENVGSGKTYQQTLADYQTIKGEAKGYEAQLKQLNLNMEKLRQGEIYDQVPVVSPINGYIEKVEVQLGQFMDPQTVMFRVVNTEHIHADLMVFEKDVYKVKKGQKITFTVESVPGSTLSAEIYSVGKKFEQNPKAVHVHAEIIQKEDFLIPGMYINGRIHTNSHEVNALPEDAIIEEEGNPYIFMAESHQESGETEWVFTPIEIRTGITEAGWVEIKLLDELPEGAKVAWNSAYYLIGEMKKGELGDDD